MGSKVAQSEKEAARIKAAAASSNSVPELRQTVEDLAEQNQRMMNALVAADLIKEE
jgi:hypothetical protein